MRSRFLVFWVLIVFLFNLFIIRNTYAATVIDGGVSTVYVRMDTSQTSVTSTVSLVADTSHSGQGHITSVTLTGYVDDEGCATSKYPITLCVGNPDGDRTYSSFTNVDDTFNLSSQPSSCWIGLIQHASFGGYSYLYVSSFTAINASGQDFIVNYSAPSSYVPPSDTGGGDTGGGDTGGGDTGGGDTGGGDTGGDGTGGDGTTTPTCDL
ncbi:hypothetical protein REC12_15470 [Desulfosporosinus sp. PR]|uniref:hypothetical protein n=1 Tax=Candidatus Desulfosporosinus nitrosoreducens TaxID=3401928 RepID=UPI0027EA0676|nr:hypothetical protein [Desulfosporosinus sp. PR]MDQ7094995.1 hypothetical protein [Desulfosporosinus sp. PR]